MEIRLNRFIAMSGVCSRRKADELIKKGLVKVDGEVVRELGTKIDPKVNVVSVYDEIIKPVERFTYLAFYKPRGVITTMKDPKDRKSIYHYLEGLPRLFPVGRLDKDSEGLLILTNDGEFANLLIHPRYKVEKRYKVLVEGNPDPKDISRLEKGIILYGKKTLPCSIKLIGDYGATKEYLVTLIEGKKRQIREMFLIIGCEVKRLIRISIGNIKLGKLKPGAYRIIGEKEIKDLKELIEKKRKESLTKKSTRMKKN